MNRASPASVQRQPTPAERASERIAGRALLGDLCIFLGRIPLIFMTGSLTLLSDGARSVFTYSASIHALYVMRALHRGRLTRYQFGVGKIEQLVVIIVGSGMTIGGLLLGQRIVSTVLEAGAVASPLGLTLAAVFNSINVAKNSVAWIALRAAAHDSLSDIHQTQIRVRSTMLITSSFLQVTLTVAALAKDDAVAILMDAIGGSFVTGLMIYRGASMLIRALPDVLDAPGSADTVTSIQQAIAEVIPDQQIVRLRTRRAGRMTFAEIMVHGGAWASPASLSDVGATIADSLARKGKYVDVSIALAPLPAG